MVLQNPFMPSLDLLPVARSLGAAVSFVSLRCPFFFCSLRLIVLTSFLQGPSLSSMTHHTVFQDMFLTKKPTAAFASPQDGNMIKHCLPDPSLLFSPSTLGTISPSPRLVRSAS